SQASVRTKVPAEGVRLAGRFSIRCEEVGGLHGFRIIWTKNGGDLRLRRSARRKDAPTSQYRAHRHPSGDRVSRGRKDRAAGDRGCIHSGRDLSAELFAGELDRRTK